MSLTEQNVIDYIGKEAICTAGLNDETVLLVGFRNGLAYIKHRERFVKGHYSNISHGCLLCNLKLKGTESE